MIGNTTKEHVVSAEYSSIIFLNIRSLRCNHDQLEVFTNSLKTRPIAIALCETWLSEKDPLSIYKLNGFQPLIVKNRQSRGGGLAIYVRQDFNYEIKEPPKTVTDIEYLTIKLSKNITNLDLTLVYKPPATNFGTFLESMDKLLEFTKVSNKSLVCGDFNIDTMHNTSLAERYKNLLKTYGLYIQNKDPTRTTATTSTCIDHVISQNFVETVTLNDKISDHSPIEVKLNEINPQITTKEKSFRRNYKCFENVNVLLRFIFLLNHLLGKIEKTLSVDEKIDKLISALNISIDRFAPLTAYKIKSGTWVDKNCQKMRRKKNQAYKNLVKNPSEENKRKYKLQRNLATKTYRNAKLQYFDRKHSGLSNTKKLYQTFNKLTNDDKNETFPFTAQQFNCFFANIGQKLGEKFPPPDKVSIGFENKHTFIPFKIQPEEVTSAIKNMKNKHSVGHDNISNKLVKISLSVISGPLSDIFNQCIAEGFYPSSFKIAKVVPIFKGGSKLDVENYRPISLLPCIDKIFEKILFIRMTKFINKYQLICPEQYGFQQKKSSCTAILDFVEKLRNKCDKSISMNAAFVDLKKAFDTINHKILLKKMKLLGFRGKFLELLESYLSNRCQYVDLKGESSDRKNINYGVPQGSVLGPLLFLLYINDLPKALAPCDTVLFADDTTIYSDNTANNFTEHLVQLEKWFIKNSLTVNGKKILVS